MKVSYPHARAHGVPGGVLPLAEHLLSGDLKGTLSAHAVKALYCPVGVWVATRRGAQYVFSKLLLRPAYAQSADLP